MNVLSPRAPAQRRFTMSLDLALLLASAAMRAEVGRLTAEAGEPHDQCGIVCRNGRLWAEIAFSDNRALLIPLSVWPPGTRP